MILDVEPSYYKRLISETVNIKLQQSGLNKQSDTDLFAESYSPILKSLSPLYSFRDTKRDT